MSSCRVMGPLSLTPALSRWEKEKHSPAFGEAMTVFCWRVIRILAGNQRLFPLPAGEGQGEGEHANRFSHRPHFF